MIKAPFLAPDGAASGSSQPTGAEPTPSAAQDPAPKAAGDEGKNGQSQTQTFDEILKNNGDFQAELDRRINKAVETATANERDRQKIIQDSLQDEVLRVSKMTQSEKDAYFKQKAEAEQRKKEESLTKRELTLDARTVLADKKLPNEFIELLNYTDRESCLKSIDTLDAAFQAAVQDAVNEKLKGSTPPPDAKSEGAPAAAKTEQEKTLAEMRALAGVRTK